MWTDQELEVMLRALDMLDDDILSNGGYTKSYERTQTSLWLRFNEEIERRKGPSPF